MVVGTLKISLDRLEKKKKHKKAFRDQEQRTAPRRSEVGVAPEVTWNVGGALRSLGHVGGAQFSRADRDHSAINGEHAEA